MLELKKWHNRITGERLVKALQKNNFEAAYFETGEDAMRYLKDIIPAGITIGIGGSSTSRELGLISYLTEKGCTVYDHNAPGLELAEKTELRRKQLTSDLFVTSTNAITLKGELVNRDGIGNRVGAMGFGPKEVLVIAGINKVVSDLDQALDRIRLHAAPINAKRHESATPCVKTGVCQDCQVPGRICNITTIIHKCPFLTKIRVIIIGEDLGY